MSDKYEKAAKEYKEKAFASSITPPFASREFGLADALRWYEEKYLADALTAAAMMREKETCETCNQHGHCFVEDTFVRCNEHHIPLKHGCVNHSGRRIVEGGAK